ncbi:MAG: methyltransferase domain-containing protein [Polyangiaceae bacterium]
MRLNVGCGRNALDGWVNLDAVALPGVNVVADLERCEGTKLPFDDDSVDELLLSHVLEHVRNVLPMMQELHRVAKPDAKLTALVPYGSSDDAFEDPTHVRQMFVGSFGYFSQPYYWRADYGYRGDWVTEAVELLVDPAYARLTLDDLMTHVKHSRNVVHEMTAVLRAVKPIREPRRELQVVPPVRVRFP